MADANQRSRLPPPSPPLHLACHPSDGARRWFCPWSFPNGAAEGIVDSERAHARRRPGVREQQRVWERQSTHLACLRSERRLRSMRSRSTSRPSVLSIPSSSPASCEIATARAQLGVRKRTLAQLSRQSLTPVANAGRVCKKEVFYSAVSWSMNGRMWCCPWDGRCEAT